jgi:hypothetical protein
MLITYTGVAEVALTQDLLDRATGFALEGAEVGTALLQPGAAIAVSDGLTWTLHGHVDERPGR